MKLVLRNGTFSALFLAVAAQAVTSKNGITLVTPAGTSYRDKIDFAQLEADYPLDKTALQTLKPEDLMGWDQESFDQLYARLSAGPIPDGIYRGTVIFANGGGLDSIAHLATDLKLPFAYDRLKNTAQALWKGKHFYKSEGVLRNMMTNVKLLQSLVQPGQTLDLESLPKATLGDETAYEIFPAKIYCGQSMLDSRRESVIIDYAYTNEIPGYQKSIDYLAGRKGMWVRDEIRMVRPGFYLGRAYMARAFVLNFTLYNAEVASASASVAEDCWVGTQKR